MVFSSIPFLFFFLVIFLIIYFLFPSRYKNLILLIFSLIFYAWGEPIYIILMVLSSVIDYNNGLFLEKYDKNDKKRKFFLVFSIIFNLFILFFFKYADFLIGIINDIFNINIPLLNLGLPIGISFYTFQTMSYSIDVYRRKVKTEHNFVNFMAYVSMFPQLIAGPIVRYETIASELHKREVDFKKFSSGFMIFLKGLFKKVLIANNIGLLFSIISNLENNEMSILLAWLGVIAFALQIYFDFSGYSDMAIGIGKMLGFTYPENFNHPYIATSITDFWRRWHMSLSTWFKDYVYISLGGNRVSKIINIRNLLIVWFLTGLWHGASFNFILWGMYYGIILIIEKFILKDFLEKLPKVLKHVYSLFLILIGWAIFAFEDIDILKNYFGMLFGIGKIPFLNSYFLYYLKNYFIILLLGIIFSTPIFSIYMKKLDNMKYKKYIYILIIIMYIILFIVTISYLVSDTYNPFLYFRF